MQPLNVGLGVLGVFSLVGIGYAVLFDFRRRNDPLYRRHLLRARRDHERQRDAAVKRARQGQRERILGAIASARNEAMPASVDGREEFFMNQVAKGESLVAQTGATDDATALEAAMCFYKAMRVYPNPNDLMSVYERTVPGHVYELLLNVMQIDATSSEGVHLD